MCINLRRPLTAPGKLCMQTKPFGFNLVFGVPHPMPVCRILGAAQDLFYLNCARNAPPFSPGMAGACASSTPSLNEEQVARRATFSSLLQFVPFLLCPSVPWRETWDFGFCTSASGGRGVTCQRRCTVHLCVEAALLSTRLSEMQLPLLPVAAVHC